MQKVSTAEQMREVSRLTTDAHASDLLFAELADARNWMTASRFSDDSHKYKRGHALVIAGSESYSGAAVLAGNAAMRSGVGLVTLAVPATIRSEVAARCLAEVIVRPLPEAAGGIADTAYDEIVGLLSGADAILVGCGISTHDAGAERLVRRVIEIRSCPVIVDASALAWCSRERVNSSNTANTPLILTPHEGEFLRLLGTGDKCALADRAVAVRKFSQENNVILVLKGERTLIGEPGGKAVVNPTGNSGLGKAGNGDTLAGILVGFVAQAQKMEIDVFETVVVGVYIAGLAGDIAEAKYGKRVMTASDVRECLVEAFNRCK